MVTSTIAATSARVIAQPCQVCGRSPNPMRLGPNHGRFDLLCTASDGNTGIQPGKCAADQQAAPPWHDFIAVSVLCRVAACAGDRLETVLCSSSGSEVRS